MHNLKSIRELLGITQQAMADGLGCTQGNVGHYERGQTLPPDMAKKLIDVAACHGFAISFDHIYGAKPLPGLRTLNVGAHRGRCAAELAAQPKEGEASHA